METENTEILVVDDDEDLLDTVYSTLIKIGFKVVTARNGEEALSIYNDRLEKNNPIKVVITDMKMPCMNGIQLVREIYKKKCQTAFIVCSAYESLKGDLSKLPCIRRIHIKPINLANIVQDLVTIFTTREWEKIPNKTLSQHKIHKKAYEAIQKILLQIV